MSRGVSSESLCSSPFSKTYADASVARDFFTDSGQNVSRRIRVGGAGTLTLEYEGGETDTVTYAAGAVDDVRIKRVTAGTATNFTIYQ